MLVKEKERKFSIFTFTCQNGSRVRSISIRIFAKFKHNCLTCLPFFHSQFSNLAHFDKCTTSRRFFLFTKSIAR